MRNLKRALSLVMAMALIVGMMVVSASAASKDFTDADEIRHPEAVNTMVALNVISGKEDGSYFDPTGTTDSCRDGEDHFLRHERRHRAQHRHQLVPNTVTSTITGPRRTSSTAPAWASSTATAPASSTPAAP